MGDAYILSLEVDDNGSVVIKNFKKNVEDAGGAADKSGKQAGEAGEGGFRLFGIAAAKAGDQIGIPFRASNMLGTQVEKLAKFAFPAWGTALGVAGGAAMVAAGVTMYLIERKKKLREELDKTITALQGEVDELYKNTVGTSGLYQAKQLLLNVEREQLQLKLAEKYQDEYEKLIKLQNEVKNGRGLWKDFKTTMAEIGSAMWENEGLSVDELKNKFTQLKNSSVREVSQIGAQLEVLYQQMLGLNRKANPVAVESNPLWLQDLQLQAAGIKDMQDGYLRARDAQIGYDQARLDNAQATGAEMADVNRMELVVFDDTTSKIILSAKTRDEAEAQYDARKIQRTTLIANQSIAIKRQQMQTEQQLDSYRLNSAVNSLDALQSLTHGRYKIIFLSIQAMHAAQAIMHGWAASAAAIAPPPIGLGPVAGAPLAAWAKAEGLTAAAAIMAQAFAGGPGGGGGGSSPTYSANPTSGLPENGGYKYYNYEQSHYGSGWRPGEGPSGGDTYIFHGDVYDKEAFDKRVNKSVQQNIINRDETAKVIRRYV